MKKMNSIFWRASLLSFLGLAGMTVLRVNAQTIDLTAGPGGNGLYNTGVEVDDLTPVPGDPTGLNNPNDPHYTFDYYATGAGGSPATVLPPVTYTTGYYGTATLSGSAFIADPLATSPYGGENWAANLPDAQWITYSGNMTNTVSTSPNTGVTVYQLVLTDIPTGDEVTIGGQIASDDNVTIYGNGKELFSNFSVTDSGGNNRDNYNQFTTLSGLTFLSGSSNTLDFVVYNSGGYATGIDAQLTGSYTVPEPSTYALLLAGLGLLYFRTRRKAVPAYEPIS